MYSVPDDENLFLNNTADLPRGDPVEETPATFCLCSLNETQCGRRAVSDTAADSNEPSVPARLAVPSVNTITTGARARRQAVVNVIVESDARVFPANITYIYLLFSCTNIYSYVSGVFWRPAL